MSAFFRKTTAWAAVLLFSIIGLVAFYSAVLPDFYLVSKGDELAVSSLFSISAKPCQSKVTVAVSGNASGSSRYTKNMLMLFGSVPIKEVQSKTVERPVLYPCGQPFGIKLITDGVMVVDLQKINDSSPAKDCGIKEGDVIVSIDGEKVKSNADVAKIIRATGGECCSVRIKRGNNDLTLKLQPKLDGGCYKAGMWVRDSSAGIGTLTFYDAETGAFGGLGHPVCDADTKEPLPLSAGTVGEINLTGFNKSKSGSPGQLLGEFANSASTGEILKNCESGVFGTLNANPCDSSSKAIPLGFRQEITTGKATILTSIDNSGPKEYDISIEQINMSESAEHDLVIKITDKELLEKTGGILQGMSGSPIIQNGRLVGAVTHVFIDDSAKGYGIFADEMYSKASDSLQSLENAG